MSGRVRTTLPIWSLRGIPGTERTVWLLESHVHCSGLAASQREWELCAQGGPLGSPQLGCWLCMLQALGLVFLPVHHSRTLPPYSLSAANFFGTCHVRLPPRAGVWVGAGRALEYEGGGMGTSLVSLLTAVKPRVTLLRSMRLHWYEPEGTKTLRLGFAIWWPNWVSGFAE